LQWGAKASGAGSIKSMGVAILASQYLNIATYNFNLILNPQGLD
jgi:hypothetical protein